MTIPPHQRARPSCISLAGDAHGWERRGAAGAAGVAEAAGVAGVAVAAGANGANGAVAMWDEGCEWVRVGRGKGVSAGAGALRGVSAISTIKVYNSRINISARYTTVRTSIRQAGWLLGASKASCLTPAEADICTEW